jgi:hypothetical protein
LKNKGDSCICYECLHPQQHAQTHELEENENNSKLSHHICGHTLLDIILGDGGR